MRSLLLQRQNLNEVRNPDLGGNAGNQKRLIFSLPHDSFRRAEKFRWPFRRESGDDVAFGVYFGDYADVILKSPRRRAGVDSVTHANPMREDILLTNCVLGRQG